MKAESVGNIFTFP